MGDAYCPIHGTVSDLHDCRPLSHRPQAYRQPEIQHDGPSRRERIATAALQGLLAGGMIQEMANGKTTGGEAAALLAKTSTGFADALIAELDCDS